MFVKPDTNTSQPKLRKTKSKIYVRTKLKPKLLDLNEKRISEHSYSRYLLLITTTGSG